MQPKESEEKDYVILVDENDQAMGSAEKMEAHREGGRLHRAFSVLVFSPDGRLMLQKRAAAKYHSQRLWTNACCSHPAPGESVEEAAHRRLKQEMGFDIPLKEVFSFVYRATLDTGLTEHEYDHVLTGTFDGIPRPDPSEVEDWKWTDLDELRADIAACPEKYTEWFKIIIGKYFDRPAVSRQSAISAPR